MEPLPPGDPEKDALPRSHRVIRELRSAPLITPVLRKLPRPPEPPVETDGKKPRRRSTK